MAVFKIKLFQLLGFSPNINACSSCGQVFDKENDELILNEGIYYDYVANEFLCSKCIDEKDKRRYIKLAFSTLIAIKYVLAADIKKIFSFELANIQDFVLFGQVYTDSMTNSV